MKKLDLNRLHQPISNARRTGRTVKMIAELLGNVYLSENEELHIVWVRDHRSAKHMVGEIIKVAIAMGDSASNICRTMNGMVFANGAKVSVMARVNDDGARGLSYREFFDHTVNEQRQGELKTQGKAGLLFQKRLP